MSAKVSAARRAAFLKGLAQTGNVTVSAERAKVSRSWVLLHRKEHAAFDAACRAALAAAGERLGAHPEGRPPSGWGFLDGAELVVRGSRDRRVQIARARLSQFSPRVEDRFLAALAATCNVKAALAEAGMSKGAAYTHRKRWPAFAARWDAAVETGYARIEIGLLEQAGNLFSSAELPDDILPDAPMAEMTVDQAMQLLHMHKNQVHGIGRAPGKWPQPPRPVEYYRASIMRKIEAITRARELSEEDKARDREEWARRRGPG
jgi:hypothetical protein